MRTRREVERARGELGAQPTELQNQTAFWLELYKTIDDAASRIGMAVDDLGANLKGLNQLDQLRDIAEELSAIRQNVNAGIRGD